MQVMAAVYGPHEVENRGDMLHDRAVVHCEVGERMIRLYAADGSCLVCLCAAETPCVHCALRGGLRGICRDMHTLAGGEHQTLPCTDTKDTIALCRRPGGACGY